MNMHPENPVGTRIFADAGEADATLRLIAGLPAPAGLEDRVKAGLDRAPAARSARLWEWPRPNWRQSAWISGAAAAAIVVVVAGGSWGVYSRVQPRQMPFVLPHVGAAGGFSSANAMRTPKTLDGPTVTQPVAKAVDRGAAAKKQEEARKKTARGAKADAAKQATR